jgi:hypothetical protein
MYEQLDCAPDRVAVSTTTTSAIGQRAALLRAGVGVGSRFALGCVLVLGVIVVGASPAGTPETDGTTAHLTSRTDVGLVLASGGARCATRAC